MAEVPAAEVPQAEKDELFCAYAGMILTDSGMDITEESLNKLIKAAGGSIDSFFPALTVPQRKTTARMTVSMSSSS